MNAVRDLYVKSKSCVNLKNGKSGYFVSFAGVRQNENISSILFSFYINSLEGFLRDEGVSPLEGGGGRD